MSKRQPWPRVSLSSKRPSLRESPRVRAALARAQAHEQAGQSDRARHLYRRVLRRVPQADQAWCRLGVLAEAAGQSQAARRLYQQALRANARSWQALYQLGLWAHQRGDFVPALEAFLKCQQLNPEFAPVFLHAAEILVIVGQKQAALRLYLQSLELDPTQEALYFGLSEILDSQGDLDLVLECMKLLCLMHPQMLGLVSFYLGYILEKRGEYAAALLCYDQALAASPLLPWRLKRAIAFPILMESRAEIEAVGARLEQTLDEYLGYFLKMGVQPDALSLSAYDAINLNLSHIAYHHYPLLNLRSKMARLIRQLLPPLPAGQLAGRDPQAPIHLGVVLAPQVNLPLAYVSGLLNHLDPQTYRLTVFCSSARIQLVFDPAYPNRLTHANLKVCILSTEVAQASQQVLAARLDALFLTEPNWDPLQYALSLQRLAPVQFTSWINPGTTGVPTVDYYLSTALCESPEAQRYYAEKLVLSETTPVWYPRIHLPPANMTRADFGLPGTGGLYLCPHTTLKFHPDFDQLLADVLQADPTGQLVLIAFKGQENLAQLLMQRFARRIPQVMERIWVLPQLDKPEFFNLLYLADVLLDPLYYGGGTTNYQAFACGLPVVSLPGEQLLSRIALGQYRKMSENTQLDFSACLASDQADYVAKAVRLGTDRAFRQQISEQLAVAAPRLFEEDLACQAFDRFLRQVCGRAEI